MLGQSLLSVILGCPASGFLLGIFSGFLTSDPRDPGMLGFCTRYFFGIFTSFHIPTPIPGIWGFCSRDFSI